MNSTPLQGQTRPTQALADTFLWRLDPNKPNDVKITQKIQKQQEAKLRSQTKGTLSPSPLSKYLPGWWHKKWWPHPYLGADFPCGPLENTPHHLPLFILGRHKAKKTTSDTRRIHILCEHLIIAQKEVSFQYFTGTALINQPLFHAAIYLPKANWYDILTEINLMMSPQPSMPSKWTYSMS